MHFCDYQRLQLVQRIVQRVLITAKYTLPFVRFSNLGVMLKLFRLFTVLKKDNSFLYIQMIIVLKFYCSKFQDHIFPNI